VNLLEGPGSSADYQFDGVYRYSLTRIESMVKKRVLWQLMLNPSRRDAAVDDAIRRCRRCP